MNEFDKYTQNYDMLEPKLSYKYYHSYRVMDNMATLAKNMCLPICDINLAKCIGLLHDIGRFEQYKRFNSFSDHFIDHGDLAVEILKTQNVLSSFDIAPSDYEVVYKAIQNHNKYTISPNLNKREFLFAKMIRDADKLDILNALSNPEIKNVIYEDTSLIRETVKESFLQAKQIKRDPMLTTNENIVVIFSFVYDFNFNLSLDILKNNKYYEKIYNRLKDKNKFKIYIDKVQEYINERID